MHATFNESLTVHRASDEGGIYAGGTLIDRADVRRMRHKLTEDAKPVAQYWTGHQWVPLFRRTDTVALPPLSAKRQAAYDYARTCVRCGDKGRDPWDKHWLVWPGSEVRAGRPMCSWCPSAEDEVQWKARANVDRAKAVSQVAALLARPDLRVLAGERHSSGNFRVADAVELLAVDASGAVVFCARIQHLLSNYDEPGDGDPIAMHADAVVALSKAFCVAWFPDELRQIDIDLTRHLGQEATLLPGYPHGRDPWDRFIEDSHYRLSHISNLAAKWVGEIGNKHRWDLQSYARLGTLAAAAKRLLGTEIDAESLHAQCDAVIAILKLIASDAHPAGTALCPQREGRDGNECWQPAVAGAFGFCAGHAPVVANA